MLLEEHLRTPCDEDSKKKERHIVSWSQEEDDILREQISIHGTDNWAIIASKFKDKTTRQCRRRWYTYLNSDFKKGGWSPEEDMLLCEAQKIFGNRWTEIAKVVSGRTDNAVKNRFSTLCKKKAKYEALAKENATSYINENNKRCIVQSGSKTDAMSQAAAPIKKIRRSHIPASIENCNYGDRLHRPITRTMNQQPRPPLAVLVGSSCNLNNLPVQQHVSNAKEIICDAAQSKIQGTFLKKDDPKVTALMQQAELLSSLAEKVNTENTDQSFENAWKVLQEFLNRSKEGDVFRYKISDTESIDLQLEDLKDLLEDLRSSNEGSQQSWRQPDLSEESPCSSEYSTGSTLLPLTTADNSEPTLAEIGASKQETGSGFAAVLAEKTSVGESENGVLSGATINQANTFLACDEQTNNDGVTSALSSNEFGSPLQVTPIFRSLAAGIPSPRFSESEKNFLLKTLGAGSPSSNPSTNASQPPPCKRALLKSL